MTAALWKHAICTMYQALLANDEPRARAILAAGADVNLRSSEGKTALGYAYDNLARCRSGERTRMNEEWILDMMERLKARGAVL